VGGTAADRTRGAETKGRDLMAAADAGATCAIQALSVAFVRVYNAGDLDSLVEIFIPRTRTCCRLTIPA